MAADGPATRYTQHSDVNLGIAVSLGEDGLIYVSPPGGARMEAITI